MNPERHSFLPIFVLLLLFQLLPLFLEAQNLVTYAGNAGKESFNDVIKLPNGKILVAGNADNLLWTNAPQTVLTITLAPGQTDILSSDPGRAFVLLMNPQSTIIERIFVFPANTVADVSRIRTTDDPTKTSDDSSFAVYISGRRTAPNSFQDGYFIARLNGNFITGAGGTGLPTGCSWYFPVDAKTDAGPNQYKTIQPWDVGSDGQVVLGYGKAYNSQWAAIIKLDANGKRTTVENWPAQYSASGELPAYKKASSYGSLASYSMIVLKAGRAGSLRSSTTGDSFWNGYFWNQNTDELGNPRVGKFPDDWYFRGAIGTGNQGRGGRLTNPSTNTYGDSVRTYSPTGSGATQRLGGIAIDRRNNHVYYGYSTQTTFAPGAVPDFEPAVVAMMADGQMKWWARCYDQKGLSPPDQYIDGVEVDYANDQLVVLGRQHGSNSIAMWRGNQVPGNSAFQNNYTGINSSATGHYSWIGKYDLIRNPGFILPVSPKIKHCTYMMEYKDPATGLGSPSSDPKLDGWPSPNSGFPDLNTTKFPAVGRLAVTPSGAVCVIGTGRRVITTSDAFQKMPKQKGNGTIRQVPYSAWSDFVRIYLPDLSSLVYSSLLTGKWDTLTEAGGSNTSLKGIFPYNGGIYVVGAHAADVQSGEAAGNPMPTAAIPTWGSGSPQGQSAIFGRLKIDANFPISLQLNPNVFCTDVSNAANRTFKIAFTPPPGYLVQINSGSSFRVELSAANGKFAGQGAGGSTTVIGTLSPPGVITNQQDTITAVFPPGLSGSGYGLRVRCLNRLIPGPGNDTIPGFWYNVTLVSSSPATPGVISGDTLICGNAVSTSLYTIRKVNRASKYEWKIVPTVGNNLDPCNLPTCAGKIGSADTSAVVVWNPNFSGTATISVRALNPCGPSPGWSVLGNIRIAPCITNSYVGSVCTGPNANSTIPFTIPEGVTISSTNSFTAQLSDVNGGFGSPINIATLNNLPAGSGPISSQFNGFNLPPGILAGTNYKIRVTGSGLSPSVQGFPGENISIRTPPTKANTPVGRTRLCFNNIRTGSLNLTRLDNSGGRAKFTLNSHGLVNGQEIMLVLDNVPALNGVWTVTSVNTDDFILQNSTYTGPSITNPGKIIWNAIITKPMEGVSNYEWSSSNPALGSFFTNNDPTTIMDWNPQQEGSTWIKVRAVNECGVGPWSDSVQFFIESCLKVNLQPNSVWCPGSTMNRAVPGGSVKLQLSKSSFFRYSSQANYEVEISDATGNFNFPVFSMPVFLAGNQALTGKVTGLQNGPGKIRLTVPNHGLYSGATVMLSGFPNGYNSLLSGKSDSITVIDSNTIQLERSPICTSNCNFSGGSPAIGGHNLGTPIDLRIPLPANLVQSSFYQIRVSCISNCGTNAGSTNGTLPFTIGPPPSVPVPVGLANAACGVTRTYSIPPVSGAQSYNWTLAPAAAGTITGSGNSVSISFTNAYTGPVANLSVSAVTGCGVITSIPLQIGTFCDPPIVDPPIAVPVTNSYRSKANNVDWKQASSWERYNGTSWVAATSYPGDDGTSNDDPTAQFIYIGGYVSGASSEVLSHNIRLDGALSADQIYVRKGTSTATLTLNSTAVLTIANGSESIDCHVFGDLRVNQGGSVVPTGNLTFATTGQYRHNYTTSAGTIPQATWYQGSTCLIEGYTTNTSPPAGLNQLFHNFNWNCQAQTQGINLQGQLANVGGRFMNTNNNTKGLALTNNSSPIYLNALENSDLLYLNTGSTIAASNTLTVHNFTNIKGDLYGSYGGLAAGNLVVSRTFLIQQGTVALSGAFLNSLATCGSPTWLVRGDASASITNSGKLVGNRYGTGSSPQIRFLKDFTLNHASAGVSGGIGSPSNFSVFVGGDFNHQLGTLNESSSPAGNFTVTVKGNYLISGGSIAESPANMALNIKADFVQTGTAVVSNAAANKGSITIGFTDSLAQCNLTTIPAAFFGNTVSLVLNKPLGSLKINQNLTYQNLTWTKGDLNLNGNVLTGNQTITLNGTGNLGTLSGSSGSELNHRWLKAQSGVLRNPDDLLLITGGTGASLNAVNTTSYVTDFLRFAIASKQVASNNFTVQGGTPSVVTLNNHPLQDGDNIVLAGTTNNGGAFNGTYTITKTGPNTFTLNSSSFTNNWNSTNNGTITRKDNFEVPLGNSSGYQGFGFNNLQNDGNAKTFRISYRATGPNEATGNKITQVGLVPGVLGKNWNIQRLSGSGTFESLEGVSAYLANGSSNLRMRQSSTSPGTTGFSSLGGVLSGQNRIFSTKTIAINGIQTTTGSWFAFGASAVVPPGNFSVPNPGIRNLSDVAAEYNDVTFSGPVTFTFDGSYDGTAGNLTNPERFPIVFKRKQSFPVTIKTTAGGRETSNSNLAGGNNTPLVVLDGVSNVTFDGAASGTKWAFVNHGTGDSANVFRLVNGATQNTLKNLDIQGSSSASGYSGAVLLGSSKAASGNSRNTISNNKIGNNQSTRKPLFIKTIKQTISPGYGDGGIIVDASNTNPVMIRTAVKHGYSSGQKLRIRNIGRQGGSTALSFASNSSPIVITSNNHGLLTGNRIYVGLNPPITGDYARDVLGNTAANGTWIITVLGPNTFSLNGSVGNGSYISPGPGMRPASWSCMDAVMQDSDYFVKAVSDSTLELFRNSALTIPYAGRGLFSLEAGLMGGSNSTIMPIIENISATTPAVVTLSANHQLKTGQTVGIGDSLSTIGITSWIITVLSPTSYSLNSSTSASFPPGPKYRHWSPPLVAVTSTPHNLQPNDPIHIQGVVFPPNANGDFPVEVIDDTTLVLRNTAYYHTPYFGPGTIFNPIQGWSRDIEALTNTTPVRYGGGTTRSWLAGDPVELSGNLNGIVQPGKYIMWTGGDNSREVILMNTRRVERPFQGTPVASSDLGLAKGIVSNNLGFTLNEENTISGNEFLNTVKGGLIVTKAGNGSRWKIQDNHFYLKGIVAPNSDPANNFSAIHFVPGINRSSSELQIRRFGNPCWPLG